MRTTSAISHATVDAAALSSVSVGETRGQVDQALGKDGSDDTTVFGAGHKPPTGTTCRYFVIKSEQHSTTCRYTACASQAPPAGSPR